MSIVKSYAVILWHQDQHISSILLDVIPYQHRYITAETVVGGHKAKILAICGKETLIYYSLIFFYNLVYW